MRPNDSFTDAVAENLVDRLEVLTRPIGSMWLRRILYAANCLILLGGIKLVFFSHFNLIWIMVKVSYLVCSTKT